MAAVDEYVPQPERDVDKPFLMPIEDVFTITGRGTVVTGRVEQGVVNTGDEVEIIGIRDTQKTTCTGVEMFRQDPRPGPGRRQRSVPCCGARRRKTWRAGRCWPSPARSPRTPSSRGQVYVPTKEEGGRHKPFFLELPAAVLLPDDGCDRLDRAAGAPRCMPGDNTTMQVTLHAPIAMDEGPALRHP